MRIQIRHDATEHRFLAEVNGAMAYLAYEVLSDDTLDLRHTYVPHLFRGQGIASQLVREALEHAQVLDFTVIPTCPFVRRFIDARPEYRGLISKSKQSAR